LGRIAILGQSFGYRIGVPACSPSLYLVSKMKSESKAQESNTTERKLDASTISSQLSVGMIAASILLSSCFVIIVLGREVEEPLPISSYYSGNHCCNLTHVTTMFRGAGVFDGIFLAGIMAVHYLALTPRLAAEHTIHASLLFTLRKTEVSLTKYSCEPTMRVQASILACSCFFLLREGGGR